MLVRTILKFSFRLISAGSQFRLQPVLTRSGVLQATYMAPPNNGLTIAKGSPGCPKCSQGPSLLTGVGISPGIPGPCSKRYGLAHWDTALLNIRLTPSPGHPGHLSQPGQDMATLTSGRPPALGHFDPALQEATASPRTIPGRGPVHEQANTGSGTAGPAASHPRSPLPNRRSSSFRIPGALEPAVL